ncbi:hypothetical protein BGZ63DRAFT_33464 [Mariannaea sp. PMI_226]|nr:hypothetical protein BGZ63DRAFT_33464 [Mariannaea sp. PMI_226]
MWSLVMEHAIFPLLVTLLLLIPNYVDAIALHTYHSHNAFCDIRPISQGEIGIPQVKDSITHRRRTVINARMFNPFPCFP